MVKRKRRIQLLQNHEDKSYVEIKQKCKNGLNREGLASLEGPFAFGRTLIIIIVIYVNNVKVRLMLSVHIVNKIRIKSV